MKISQLIYELSGKLKRHGDIDVRVVSESLNAEHSLKIGFIFVGHHKENESLEKQVLIEFSKDK